MSHDTPTTGSTAASKSPTLAESALIPLVMTPKEVAAFLRISKTAVYTLCHSGVIPHLKVGGNIRILRLDFERYLDMSRVEAVGVATEARREPKAKSKKTSARVGKQDRPKPGCSILRKHGFDPVKAMRKSGTGG